MTLLGDRFGKLKANLASHDYSLVLISMECFISDTVLGDGLMQTEGKLGITC